MISNTYCKPHSKKAVSFKCSNSVTNSLNRLMVERAIDRTSVIKLALYLFDGYMQRSDVQRLNLFELVRHIEQEGPENRLSYGDFSER